MRYLAAQLLYDIDGKAIREQVVKHHPDTNAPMLDQAGRPIMVDGDPITMATAIRQVCRNAPKADAPDAEAKAQLFSIILKVRKATKTFDLSAEEIQLVKRIAGKTLEVEAFGVLVAALESPAAPDTAAEPIEG